ncbi:MAG TPA: BPSS1780 family membrane protein [Wenzhouxiangella sp.]|nr:BPSS1780 family membrane protein [Wenzhouxiangella sp.]
MSSPDYRKPGFGAGLRWLPAAGELLFSGFGPLAGLAALWLLVSTIAIIPLAGQLAIMLITPLLTAGAITAFAQVSSGQRPAPTMLFAAWGRPELRNRLLGLGAFGLLGSLVALLVLSAWLSGQVSPEQIQAAQQSPDAITDLLEQLSFGPVLLLPVAILAVVMAAMYFAIPLLIFRGMRITGALSTSLRAVLANWSAFLGFGLATIGLVLALGFVFAVVAMPLSLALGPAGSLIVQVLFMLTAMLIQVLMAGAQWVAFVSVFGAPGSDRNADDGNQLLA